MRDARRIQESDYKIRTLDVKDAKDSASKIGILTTEMGGGGDGVWAKTVFEFKFYSNYGNRTIQT